jgi:DNA-binding MarR family transcriptional regulator
MVFSPPARAVLSLRVALEPVYNALNSFSLLTATEELPGLNPWVVQTAAALTAEQRRTNRLVFEGLRDALTPEQDVADFPAYLKQLYTLNSDVVRKRVLEGLRSRFARRVPSEGGPSAPDAARLLSDLSAYLTCVEYVQVGAPFDPTLQSEVHALLQNAMLMHFLIVSHLEELWKTFATEWKRVQGFLRWQVEMFTRSLDEEATLAETFHTFTGRELPPDLPGRLVESAEILLVPSWHTGRHVTLWEHERSARLFFSEPPNYDVSLLRSTPVGLPELRARLAALGDEKRLRILEMLVQRNEMHAQEIIAALGLSQSNASRHLKQLVSLGYLYERRGEGANKTYRLSSFYIERTARALERMLLGTQPASETHDETQSQELRRFLDRSGKLTLWPPAKHRDKLLVLEYLASFFEQGRMYSEQEVNTLLQLHSTFRDAAALRRALYEYRFLNRTRNGSQYWLISSEVAE